MIIDQDFDVIIVGGGHAGCEAAHAAAKLGSKVLLITMNFNQLAMMSCNPAVGGVAKGQIVREIDALGGMMGIIADRSALQFRMLNRSKGPAMWSPRVQSDLLAFSNLWRLKIESCENIFLRQDVVESLWIVNGQIKGVITRISKFRGKSVILTNGTFLNARIHVGENSFEGGRLGDSSVKNLSENLISLGFESNRLKTGTPVRIDGRSIDFSKFVEQKGDIAPSCFSYLNFEPIKDQMSCFLAYTNTKCHEILAQAFDKSPMFTGRIQGVGPRYCPSIEDKLNRFADKDRHQLFIEPMGRNSISYYINGFSSSLPEKTQIDALRAVIGFENARALSPGYAIEYDFFYPTQLKHSLETKLVKNLFFAGQINGTTGYEEAAAQGLMAGINAHRNINNLSEIVLQRSQAYIGVLIDDLVTKGVEEPYRMFTSRAEYRILLRQDNADERLTPLAYELGLADSNRLELLNLKRKSIDSLIGFVSREKISAEQINQFLYKKGTAEISQKTSLKSLLLRPQILLEDIIAYLKIDLLDMGLELSDYKVILEKLDKFDFSHSDLSRGANCEKERGLFIQELEAKLGFLSNLILEQVEIRIKYNSYIAKEQEGVERFKKFESISIFQDFDYQKLKSISSEGREKLSKFRPDNIGQASRIAGVSASDISVLIVHIRNAYPNC